MDSLRHVHQFDEWQVVQGLDIREIPQSSSHLLPPHLVRVQAMNTRQPTAAGGFRFRQHGDECSSVNYYSQAALLLSIDI
jgi:hypothetical protein